MENMMVAMVISEVIKVISELQYCIMQPVA